MADRETDTGLAEQDSGPRGDPSGPLLLLIRGICYDIRYRRHRLAGQINHRGCGVSGESLLERLPDQHRIAVMLRADGWGYGEIGVFLGVPIRTVRHLLAQATRQYPGVLDHRRSDAAGRLMRLVYLMGVSDGAMQSDQGVDDFHDMIDSLDMLVERSRWLQIRMENQAKLASTIK